MNKKTRVIIDELIKNGLITKEEDLTANSDTNLLFDYMINKYSYLLGNDVDEVLSKKDFEKGKIIHEIIVRFGKYFLKNPQVIENKEELLKDNFELRINKEKEVNEPVIFISNHAFKDDILATILAAKDRAFIVFGSLPQFYGSIDGLLAAKNGVVMVNRKIKDSKKASIEKGKKVLENNTSLLMCPEGVWDKTPNKIMLDFFDGFYRIAKKEDNTFYKIVPIIHYISNTHKKGRDNKIHTVVDEPIVLDGMNQEEAITYIRERMIYRYWTLMEKHGKTTREELLKGFDSSSKAWEYELEERVKTADKYDYEIETSADKITKKAKENDPIKVWEPIANLEINKYNAKDVIEAKKLVKTLKENDYQHRY